MSDEEELQVADPTQVVATQPTTTDRFADRASTAKNLVNALAIGAVLESLIYGSLLFLWIIHFTDYELTASISFAHILQFVSVIFVLVLLFISKKTFDAHLHSVTKDKRRCRERLMNTRIITIIIFTLALLNFVGALIAIGLKLWYTGPSSYLPNNRPILDHDGDAGQTSPVQIYSFVLSIFAAVVSLWQALFSGILTFTTIKKMVLNLRAVHGVNSSAMYNNSSSHHYGHPMNRRHFHVGASPMNFNMDRDEPENYASIRYNASSAPMMTSKVNQNDDFNVSVFRN
ncbi:MAG: hypothetical protein MUO21_09580 [Nitrososphaeraceae archaeon]|nr:hypothetical protein [Nitrososphaeraceae archaeon]